MSATPNLLLQDVPANSLQPSVPVNAGLRVLDAVVQLAIQTTTNTPPATTSPADLGKRWIVGESPSGAWVGHASAIALCVGADLWQFIVPAEGWAAYDRGADVWRDFGGSAWAQRNAAVGGEFAGLITGLILEWVSGTSLRVRSGAAHIESTGKVFAVPSSVTKSSLSLSNDTTYHVFLYSNAGTPDIEIVTTAPAAAYSGTARSKTGDASRRYLGSVRSDGAGSMYNFLMSGHSIAYRNIQDGSPFRVLSGGTSTTETSVSLSAVVPATAFLASIRLINTATSGNLYTGTSDDSAAGPPSSGIVGLSPGQAFIPHPLNGSQAMTYWYDATPVSGSAYIDVYGYAFER
jgi:hypothetical protein